MVKSCCACGNTFEKGNRIHFYRFLEDSDLRAKWISAVCRKGWCPTQSTQICSKNFIIGEKSTDPLCPDFFSSVLSLFLPLRNVSWKKVTVGTRRESHKEEEE